MMLGESGKRLVKWFVQTFFLKSAKIEEKPYTVDIVCPMCRGNCSERRLETGQLAMICENKDWYSIIPFRIIGGAVKWL